MVVLKDGCEYAAENEGNGYFSAEIEGLTAGALYWIRLDDSNLLADPASRFQPEGPSGPSMVIDPHSFSWSDGEWEGVRGNLVLYEMHIGTFTKGGTWATAKTRLRNLQEVGATCLEIMPINEFEGEFGWGYDGILLYAPTRLYGAPDDVRDFVNEAHCLGMSVILDVVYNHFGHGDRFTEFTPCYFTDLHSNEWGKSINFDGPDCNGVREYVSKNAAYWVDEYHFDGLRIDATQALFDSGTEHILAVIAKEARAAARGRTIYLVGESEPQETRIVRSEQAGGYGLDALWNDDFHHSALAALTGRHSAYLHDHRGSAQELVSTAKYGFQFQGQRYDWQDGPRGGPSLDLEAANFVHFLENHDQIANSGTGARLAALASPARVRAMTALHLLGPQTPMLFQGQEFGATTPFYYFADRDGDIARSVRKGRIDFLRQFPNLTDEKLITCMPDPCDRRTFESAKLDWAQWREDGVSFVLHRDLLALRRNEATFAAQASARRGALDGSVLSQSALLLRYFAQSPKNERLLVFNFGTALDIDSVPDPLFAPPAGLQWQLLWSSEDPVYGGGGRRPYDFHARWILDADIALVLGPFEAAPQTKPTGEEMRAWQRAVSCL
ncbi:alpha-amylase family glycosyl hydrolase [Rhizobium sp. BK251]|uniref:alpha-amylase family glycosyl hydrolase n=1 Tax=Rhizobium sp. BK251 TaxID=2512125 RepID=UPI0010F0196D|nr:alpha-amylase family glycosyl hydrolase [Rhizobium sp. BK251]TCL66311.1 maltooligosyl trehalose hydrolase [Rhizobium sp. BK251]